MLRAELRAAVVQPFVRIRLVGLIRNLRAVLYASDHIYGEADVLLLYGEADVLLRPLPLRSLVHSLPDSACGPQSRRPIELVLIGIFRCNVSRTSMSVTSRDQRR